MLHGFRKSSVKDMGSSESNALALEAVFQFIQLFEKDSRSSKAKDEKENFMTLFDKIV